MKEATANNEGKMDLETGWNQPNEIDNIGAYDPSANQNSKHTRVVDQEDPRPLSLADSPESSPAHQFREHENKGIRVLSLAELQEAAHSERPLAE